MLATTPWSRTVLPVVTPWSRESPDVRGALVGGEGEVPLRVFAIVPDWVVAAPEMASSDVLLDEYPRTRDDEDDWTTDDTLTAGLVVLGLVGLLYFGIDLVRGASQRDSNPITTDAFDDNPVTSPYRFESLAKIDRWVGEAKRRGVSEVARSSRGFLTAYRKAGGDPRKLSDYWRTRRNGFIARHMAQAKKNREVLRTKDGYSDRGLALLMWAYNPPMQR